MAAPQLPAKMVIAECYAATEPSEKLWQKYIETVSRLKEGQKISANEYYLLRYSQVAHKELMELTVGDEDVITEGTVQEILEGVKMEIRKTDLDLLKEERRILEETKREGLEKLNQERLAHERTEQQLVSERSANRTKLEGLQRNI
jgi:hypothetical protein